MPDYHLFTGHPLVLNTLERIGHPHFPQVSAISDFLMCSQEKHISALFAATFPCSSV